jgi:hypothetical protein
MTLDEAVLEETRARRERFVDLQLDADVAKREYHAGIRRLHASGGSLREIADALGVSHQLVHQIVDAGDPPARPTATIQCTFCRRSQKVVKKLIAGPGVYICDECVDLATPVAAGRADEVTRGDQVLRRVGQPAAIRCSFCSKKVREVRVLVSGGGEHICDECIALCRDIIDEETNPGTQ